MNLQMFNTLAEPNRLHIVEFLHEQPRSVGEIVHKLHLNQPQVSKHLKVLADAGILDMKPAKNKRIYGLKPEPFKQLDKWLEKYRHMWEERFERLDTLLREQKKI